MTNAAISRPRLGDRQSWTADGDDLAIADALGDELARLSRLVQRSGRGRESTGLDRGTFDVLVHLAAADGPQRFIDLARALCTAPSAVSRRVAPLLGQGLVERRADPDDGRASLLAITDDGRRALEQSRSLRTHRVAAVVRLWPVHKRRSFVILLADFCAELEQRGQPPAPAASRRGKGI